jgi:hypothetical protein
LADIERTFIYDRMPGRNETDTLCDKNSFSGIDIAPGRPKQCLCNKRVPVPLPKTKLCSEEGGECSCAGSIYFSTYDSIMNAESITNYARLDN